MIDNKRTHKRLINLIVVLFVFINLGLVKTVEGNTQNIRFSESDKIVDRLTNEVPYYQPVERFGITAPLGFAGYDLESINVRAALDWNKDSTFPLPPEIEYIHVLRVRNDLYDGVLASLPILIPANPGEVWIIGNEPDTTYEVQDNVYAEVYAARYYEIATIIRALDPSAKLVFGNIVQPTPIRLHYLDFALNELDALSGSRESSLALIDIWSIHAFILNESGGWGTGVPLGYEELQPDSPDYWGEPLVITDLSETYSIDMFMDFVVDFRDWMNSKGEQNKPLWITEYGSLLPPRDPPDYIPPGWPTTQDTINYMTDTFDFLLSETDSSTGFPADNDHLVQRWFWYSLNDHLDSFGGSLFNPDNKEITLVGEAFRDYTDRLIPRIVFLPIVKR